MTSPPLPPWLQRALEGERLHSAYLVSGPRPAARTLALRFARATVCRGAERPCEACRDCRRSGASGEIAIDGSGKRGPLYRQVGDHADLYWVERGADDTRVRIAQIRALQQALRLRSGEGGARTAVVADAEWLNQEAQNALLRLLEEPPPRTVLVLVSTSAAGLLATVRSRCQRVPLAPESRDPLAAPEAEAWLARFDALERAPLPDLLDWAEEFRGARASAAEGLEQMLEWASAWLRRRVRARVETGESPRGALGAARTLSACRRDLVQRNANPQMTAERALLALQAGTRG